MCTHRRSTSIRTLLIVGGVTAVVCLGVAVSPVAADEHRQDNAVDVTDDANFTVAFPFQTDHHPGDQNEENGSIQYFFSPEDAFAELGVEDEGAFGDYLIIDAPWIDYSACDVDNTAAFGIDRGNNNSGTQGDVDLVARQKNVDFRDDGLTIEFYDWDDIANDPPHMRSEDAIVAEQGARSSSGSCLTVANEPGWYQIEGFLNGTAADSGPDQRPSEDADTVAGMAFSNYLYVCECESRAEAEEQLGPAPDDEPTEPTPTPTPEGEETPTETPETTETPTPTPETTETPTPTETPAESTATPEETRTPTSTATPTTEQSDESAGGPEDSDQLTPTPADGPGLTALPAVLSLLAVMLASRVNS